MPAYNSSCVFLRKLQKCSIVKFENNNKQKKSVVIEVFEGYIVLHLLARGTTFEFFVLTLSHFRFGVPGSTIFLAEKSENVFFSRWGAYQNSDKRVICKESTVKKCFAAILIIEYRDQNYGVFSTQHTCVLTRYSTYSVQRWYSLLFSVFVFHIPVAKERPESSPTLTVARRTQIEQHSICAHTDIHWFPPDTGKKDVYNDWSMTDRSLCYSRFRSLNRFYELSTVTLFAFCGFEVRTRTRESLWSTTRGSYSNSGSNHGCSEIECRSYIIVKFFWDVDWE